MVVDLSISQGPLNSSHDWLNESISGIAPLEDTSTMVSLSRNSFKLFLCFIMTKSYFFKIFSLQPIVIRKNVEWTNQRRKNLSLLY